MTKYNLSLTLQLFQNQIYFQALIFSAEKISLDRHLMKEIGQQAIEMEEVNQLMI